MENLLLIFESTMSNNQELRQSAEAQLKTIILDKTLLNIFFECIKPNSNIQSRVKLAFSVFVKNYVKDFFNSDSDDALANPDKVMREDSVLYFKEGIIMILRESNQYEKPIVSMIGECIISIYNFNKGYGVIWPNLVTDLSNILNEANIEISALIYKIIAEFTIRYTMEYRSDRLFEEIIDCMKICKQMTSDLGIILNLISSSSYDQKSLVLFAETAKNIMTIAYNFNYQDFPAFFEDHLQAWISILLSSSTISASINHDEVISLNAVALRMLNKYVSSYYDDIKDYFPQFINPIWQFMLASSGLNKDTYEKIIGELLEHYKYMFTYSRINLSNDEINTLISNLIIPHIGMTNRDFSDFEDNKIQFLKSELEEVEDHSNQANAINLLKTLSTKYEQLHSSVIKPYYLELFAKYKENPGLNWSQKILGINLIFTSIERFSTAFGASSIRISAEELSDLTKEIVIDELSSISSNEIVKVYSFKFLVYFRMFIPKDWLGSIVSLLVGLINQNSGNELFIYGPLLCLEKFLFMRNVKDLKDFPFQQILTDVDTYNLLFNCLMQHSGFLNQTAAKCLFKMVLLTNSSFFPNLVTYFQSNFINIIVAILENKDKAVMDFTYFFFETLAYTLKTYYSLSPDVLYRQLRDEINPYLAQFIDKQIIEYQGFIFQIYSLQLYLDSEFNNLQNGWLIFILQESNWTIANKHLFSAFINYLIVLMIKNKQIISATPEYQKSILHIIIKLCELKRESICYDLLSIIINVYDYNELSIFPTLIPSLVTIQSQLEIAKSKTYRDLKRNVLIFFSKFLIKYGFASFLECYNGYSTEAMQVLSGLLASLRDIDSFDTRRLVIYSYCQTLRHFYSQINVAEIIELLMAMIESLNGFHKLSNYYVSDDAPADINDPYASAQVASHKLVHCEIPSTDNQFENLKKENQEKQFYNAVTDLTNKLNFNMASELTIRLQDKHKQFFNRLMETGNNA